MKRDLQLIKKILLEIEDKYVNQNLLILQIEGYTIEQIANHCELLYNEGLLQQYKGIFGNGQLNYFTVGNLTNEGFNYLDSIRNTDDLESHKNFNVYIDNSTNYNGKVVAKKGIIGDNNRQDIDENANLGLHVNLPNPKT